MVKIAVVGAGIIGLSTAVIIRRQIPQAKVTILADKFDTETTSYGAGGLFRPTGTFIKGVDPKIIKMWTRDSAQHFLKIASSPEAGEFGVFPISGYHLSNKTQDPEYKDLIYSFREMTPIELNKIGSPYSKGYAISTLIIEPTLYIPRLMKEFKERGGLLQKQTVQNLEELVGQFDIVVNCTGLGSKWLLNDPLVYPVRGQILKVDAPWLKTFLYTDDDAYVIPRSTDVVVGGCRQKDDYSTELRNEDTAAILEKCCKLVPSVAKARVVQEWAGLRPHRDPLRLEVETISGGLPVVHNYGHGSNGIGLSWGTALHATQLVKDCMAKLTMKSQL